MFINNDNTSDTVWNVVIPYTANKNIRELDQIMKEIEQGYYPMQPNKFHDELSRVGKDSFFSLLRSFSIWYLLVIFSFFVSFKMLEFFPLLIAVGIPAIIVLVLTFRSLFWSLLATLTPLAAVKEEIKERSNEN